MNSQPTRAEQPRALTAADLIQKLAQVSRKTRNPVYLGVYPTGNNTVTVIEHGLDYVASFPTQKDFLDWITTAAPDAES